MALLFPVKGWIFHEGIYWESRETEGDGSKGEHRGMGTAHQLWGQHKKFGIFLHPGISRQELSEPFIPQLLTDWKNSASQGFGNRGWKICQERAAQSWSWDEIKFPQSCHCQARLR